ncbi:c-type cytochrome, partial [Enterococcus lactis]|uniref:c-type cytochrome n=1 Tax=Enterococcus lactis TaxID=357441 RepID=UPI0039080F31
YTEGAPEANVPACVTCHGPEAQGAGPIARLAGQLFKYTRKQLLNWSTDRIPDPALAEKLGVMRPVARSLSKTQIDALASYLNWLK